MVLEIPGGGRERLQDAVQVRSAVGCAPERLRGNRVRGEQNEHCQCSHAFHRVLEVAAKITDGVTGVNKPRLANFSNQHSAFAILDRRSSLCIQPYLSDSTEARTLTIRLNVQRWPSVQDGECRALIAEVSRFRALFFLLRRCAAETKPVPRRLRFWGSETRHR